MRKMFLPFALLLLICVLAATYAQGEKVLLREEFNNLDDWKPLHFEKIPKHTIYTIESEGDQKYLRARSIGSASGLVYKKQFNVYRYPHIRWRWKAENVYKKGNAKKKEGDDYPIRVYIIFKYDPKQANFFEKLKYNSAKALYGEYPPHSGLNYIWANREHRERIITNTYSDKAQMILLQQGTANVGKWQTEEVDVLKDYQEAFGEKPPATASLAIMNDSDNTGERAVSYIDFIEVYRKQ